MKKSLLKHSLIENESAIINTLRNCECISLPKENFQEIESKKEDVTRQIHQFTNDFLDEFNKFETKFTHKKLNHLKVILLILHQKAQETR